MVLHRYWIEFDVEGGTSLSLLLKAGCGVTAETLDEARRIVREKVFAEQPLPPIVRATEDVDVSSLDAGHVLPNIGNVLVKGIWWPACFS